MAHGYIVKSKPCIISLFQFPGTHMMYCTNDYAYGTTETHVAPGGQYFVIPFAGHFHIHRWLECGAGRMGERLSSNTVISHSTNTFKQLTLWCVKKVVMDKQPSPIWENILNTLDADPPANKMAKQRRKLPAGNFVPGRNGWLCHVSLGLGHLGFEHVVVTTAWVPTWYTSTCGLSCLQLRQKPNNRSNWVRNTMCFGSVRRFVPFAETL